MDVVLARRAGCKKSQIKAKLFFCFTTLPITSMGKRAMNNERPLLQVSLSPPAHSLSLSPSLSLSLSLLNSFYILFFEIGVRFMALFVFSISLPLHFHSLPMLP